VVVPLLLEVVVPQLLEVAVPLLLEVEVPVLLQVVVLLLEVMVLLLLLEVPLLLEVVVPQLLEVVVSLLYSIPRYHRLDMGNSYYMYTRTLDVPCYDEEAPRSPHERIEVRRVLEYPTYFLSSLRI
jgi:hypothetical protein